MWFEKNTIIWIIASFAWPLLVKFRCLSSLNLLITFVLDLIGALSFGKHLVLLHPQFGASSSRICFHGLSIPAGFCCFSEETTRGNHKKLEILDVFGPTKIYPVVSTTRYLVWHLPLRNGSGNGSVPGGFGFGNGLLPESGAAPRPNTSHLRQCVGDGGRLCGTDGMHPGCQGERWWDGVSIMWSITMNQTQAFANPRLTSNVLSMTWFLLFDRDMTAIMGEMMAQNIQSPCSTSK